MIDWRGHAVNGVSRFFDRMVLKCIGEKIYMESDMQEFVCHKRVRAAKIRDIAIPITKDGARLQFHAGYGVDAVDVSESFLHRHHPEPGMYFVLYEDGYTSISPAEAFERGYSKTGSDTDGSVEVLLAGAEEKPDGYLKLDAEEAEQVSKGLNHFLMASMIGIKVINLAVNIPIVIARRSQSDSDSTRLPPSLRGEL